MSATEQAVAGAIPRVEAAQIGLRTPSVMSAGLMITWIKILLKTRGLKGTFAWIRRRVENIPPTEEVGLEAVRAAEYNVAMAGALYPARALCLEQSLTLYYILRRQLVAVRFRQGVQPYPFIGHAWVEYRNEVVNDILEHVKLYSPLPDPLP